MVQNKKRIISLILMLTLLVSSLVIGAITASAAENTTIQVTGTTGKLDGTESISWSNGNYKVVNYKNTSSTAIRTSDSDHFRVYVGNKFTVSGVNGEKISKVVINCVSSYLINNTSNKVSEGWTVSASGTAITYTATSGAAEELTITIGKQSRVKTVVVTPATVTEPETPACKHANTTETTKKATCTEDGSTTVTCNDCGNIVSTETIPANGHNYEDGACSACGAEIKSAELVTDVSTLKVGDKIIIVAKNANYALSTTQKDNNRASAGVTKNGGAVTFGDDVQIIILKAGTVEGTFAFNVGNGYLYAASSSANHLKTQTTENANGSWKIEISETGVATIKAQGTYTRNWLRYNATETTGNLFSCYSSGQTDVAIYKLVCNHADNDNNHKCDTCGEIVSECADNNKDHKCDVCETEMGTHEDGDDNDHLCDYGCGATLSVHSWSNATCTELAKCACGATTGSVDASNHTGTAQDLTSGGTADKHAVYSCCGATANANHSYNTVKHDATNHWNECSCGAKSGVTAHQYNIPNSNDDQHWNECSCGTPDTKVNHTYTNYTSNGDATCTADGTETGTCTCGAKHTRDDEGSKLEHTYTNYTSNGDATCTANGTETGTCTCGATDTRVDTGSKLEHSEACDHVAVVGDVAYTSLQDAVDAANGNTVTLVKDVVLSKYLDIKTANNGEIARDFTLNLNRHTISPAEGYNYNTGYPLVFVGINQTLTIKGEGTITADMKVTVGVYGTLKIDSASVTIENKMNGKSGDDAALCIWSWDPKIDGYDYPSNVGGSADISNVTINGDIFLEEGTNEDNKTNIVISNVNISEGALVISSLNQAVELKFATVNDNTIVLNHNITISNDLAIVGGSVLDLNGQTLTADAVITFDGTIIDSTGKGKIVVKADKFKISEGNYGYAPLHVETKDGISTYVITPVKVQGVTAELTNTAVVRPSLKGQYTNKDLFFNNVIDHGISFELLVTRTNGNVTESATLTFTEKQIHDLFDDNKSAIKITLVGGLEGYTYTVALVVKSGTTMVHSTVVAIHYVPVTSTTEEEGETTND